MGGLAGRGGLDGFLASNFGINFRGVDVGMAKDGGAVLQAEAFADLGGCRVPELIRTPAMCPIPFLLSFDIVVLGGRPSFLARISDGVAIAGCFVEVVDVDGFALLSSCASTVAASITLIGRCDSGGGCSF